MQRTHHRHRHLSSLVCNKFLNKSSSSSPPSARLSSPSSPSSPLRNLISSKNANNQHQYFSKHQLRLQQQSISNYATRYVNTTTMMSSATKDEEDRPSTTSITAAKATDGKSNNNDTATTESSPTNAVDDVPPGHQLITEGQITMLYPQSENSVFYNPVQVQNRDLSVLMLGMYAERRTERRWVGRRRKEARKELMLSQQQQKEKEEGKSTKGEVTNEKKKRTKEQRKAESAAFESAIEARVAADKSSVDFTKLTLAAGDTADGISVFEALAASGLRSLRYWKEVPGVRTIVVNDLDPVAVDMARENVARNGFSDDLAKDDDDDASYGGAAAAAAAENGDPADEKSSARNPHVNLRPRGLRLQVGDATHEMYVSRIPPSLNPSQMNPSQSKHQKPQYDVIDLDPYGSAAPFTDAAVQSVVDGGMLAITCTDMAALGGSHPETCYGRYGGFPIQRAGYLQELALRILLYHVSVTAGRYGRTIRPVLSVGMAFYCRVFVEVYDDKAGVNELSLNHGHLFQSSRCSSFHVTPVATNESVAAQQSQSTENGEQKKRQGKTKKPSNVYKNGRGPCSLDEPVCGETGAGYKVAGPLWTGPLHDTEVVNDAISRLEAAQDNEGVNPTGGSPMHSLHTATTLHGLLVAVSEELPDVPLYHLLPSLCSSVNSQTIPMQTFRAALANAGYRASAYHKDPSAVKTDAPNHVVWDIVRAWCKENPPAKRKESKRHRKGEEAGSSAGAQPNKPTADTATRILSNEMRTEVDFTVPEGFGERKKAKRWALNPEANWGPKKAASGKNKRKAEEVRDSEDDVVGGPDAKQSKS